MPRYNPRELRALCVDSPRARASECTRQAAKCRRVGRACARVYDYRHVRWSCLSYVIYRSSVFGHKVYSFCGCSKVYCSLLRRVLSPQSWMFVIHVSKLDFSVNAAACWTARLLCTILEWLQVGSWTIWNFPFETYIMSNNLCWLQAFVCVS